MENLGYLITAYAIIWVAVFGYVFWLARKIHRVSKDLLMIERKSSS